MSVAAVARLSCLADIEAVGPVSRKVPLRVSCRRETDRATDDEDVTAADASMVTVSSGAEREGHHVCAPPEKSSVPTAQHTKPKVLV